MLHFPVEYSYIALSGALLALWLACFYLLPQTRKRQLTIILYVGPLIPIQILYLIDYWHPPAIASIPFFGGYLSVEDLIFAFAFFGIASVCTAFFVEVPNGMRVRYPMAFWGVCVCFFFQNPPHIVVAL